MSRLTVIAWMIVVAVSASALQASDEANFFRDQVEPILRSRCYDCHSHASGEMNGGLALDWRSGWQDGGDRGPALVPGDPEKSLLVRAVRHFDPDLKMPEEKLPDSEIAVLEAWVRRGAFDPRAVRPAVASGVDVDWWSLRPLVKPEIPAGAIGNPIDAFIEAKLRERGMTSSPEADRRQLMRRLYFDLHGLPPSLEELQAFLDDRDERAWERLVDKALASPRYGERWARHWFDTIHFADTHGFEHDELRPNAWRYRDYVIERLNQDVPWDLFLREQLAADVFFPDEPWRQAALGFLGAGPYDRSAAGTAPMSFEYLDRDDLVTQTMSAFASTTANCARCHEHKFDPITQEDYYALQAVFAGIGKGDITFDVDPSLARERRRWGDLRAAAERQDAAILLNADSQGIQVAWEAQRGSQVTWKPLVPDVFLSSDGAVLERLPDASIRSGGARPDKDTISVTGTVDLQEVSAVRLDVLTDESLPKSGPGRMDNGNLHLSEFEVQVFRPGAAQPEKLKVRKVSADFDQAGWTCQHAIDGDPKTAWGIFRRVGEPHHAVFELDRRVTLEPGARLAVTLRQWHGGGHLIGRLRLSLTDAPGAAAMALPSAAEVALGLPRDQRSPEQQLAVAAAVLARVAEESLAALPPPVKVYGAGPRAENERGMVTFSEPRVIRVLKRGDLAKPGETVTPGAMSAVRSLAARFPMPPNGPEGARRAALADWLADSQNPLTWRSIANRVWHYHFGKGICDTPSDFGRMGGTPSHPELLDWLAAELRDHRGSLKHLHRLICTSLTYRQSTVERPDASAIDPDNRLLWRMNRLRLDADSFRDAVLAVSGKLDLAAGGPGMHYFKTLPGIQVTPVLDYSNFDWEKPGAGRRSIYRVVWRGITDPFLDTLDFPDAALLTPSRSFSASPLQALALLNNDFVLHHSEKLAQRVEPLGADSTKRVRAAVRLVWLRDPSDVETAELTELADRYGLPAVCRVLLNSNEFLFGS